MDRVYVYAFDGLHRVVGWHFIRREYLSIHELRRVTEAFAESIDVALVVAVDNFQDLYLDYKRATKNPGNFVECLCFEDEIRTRGIVLCER